MIYKLNNAVLVPGPAGAIETLADLPQQVEGIALIGHPHPLFGGTNSNKVVYTLARTLAGRGYVALRPNFRGVGKSGGEHDDGEGETDDLLALLGWAQQRWGASLPVALGGFSFGAYVATRLANRLADAGTPPRFLALAGLAAGFAAGGSAKRYVAPPVPKGVSTLVIHGEVDDTVELINVLDWARPQNLPVIVIPGADHFFHGRLQLIRELVSRWV